MKSNEMIYRPQISCTEENYCSEYEKVIKTNEEHINSIEEKAIANNSLLYRFLYESVADGKAIYQIIKLNKTTARVRLCCIDGLYTDYVVPQWGIEATVPLSYVQKSIAGQDALRKIFKK